MAGIAEVFTADVTHLEDAVIITMQGELDAYTAPALREVTMRALQEGHRTLLIDAAGLSFIDLTGMGLLVALSERTQAEGGSMRMVGASHQVTRALDLAGLSEL